MKRILIFLLLVPLFYFCLQSYLRYVEQPPDVDQTLISLVEEWRQLMENNGIEHEAGFNRIDIIRISYDNSMSGHSDKINREIVINENQLRSGLYSSRAVVYHELGHYVFCLKHDSKKSIMYSKDLGESYYKNNWETLQNNYINKCKDKEYEGKY